MRVHSNGASNYLRVLVSLPHSQARQQTSNFVASSHLAAARIRERRSTPPTGRDLDKIGFAPDSSERTLYIDSVVRHHHHQSGLRDASLRRPAAAARVAMQGMHATGSGANCYSRCTGRLAGSSGTLAECCRLSSSGSSLSPASFARASQLNWLALGLLLLLLASFAPRAGAASRSIEGSLLPPAAQARRPPYLECGKGVAPTGASSTRVACAEGGGPAAEERIIVVVVGIIKRRLLLLLAGRHSRAGDDDGDDEQDERRREAEAEAAEARRFEHYRRRRNTSLLAGYSKSGSHELGDSATLESRAGSGSGNFKRVACCFGEDGAGKLAADKIFVLVSALAECEEAGNKLILLHKITTTTLLVQAAAVDCCADGAILRVGKTNNKTAAANKTALSSRQSIVAAADSRGGGGGAVQDANKREECEEEDTTTTKKKKKKFRIRRRDIFQATREPNAATSAAARDDELIEFLAEFYAHREVLESEIALLVRQIELSRGVKQATGSEGLPPPPPEVEAANKSLTIQELGLHATTSVLRLPTSISKLERADVRQLASIMLKADHDSLMNWLRNRQKNFHTLANTTFELLEEYPNRSINVCKDGPKILILPDGKDILHCYTRDQWIGKLWSDLRLSAYHYPIIALNILIFLFGTTGNIFVCLSVYRNHQLRNVTNYFIVNLAFADFLVILICLPATGVWDLTLTWFFGTIPCKLIMFLQDVSISVSVLTLTAISLDRYYAICHPLKFKSNLSQAKRIIALIWIVSLIIMAPDLIYLSAKESQELSEAGLDTVLYSDCNYDWSSQCSSVFQFIKTILLYMAPLILMFCAHYTIMQTLRVASSSCINELQSLPPEAHSTTGGGRWIRAQSQRVVGAHASASGELAERRNQADWLPNSSPPAYLCNNVPRADDRAPKPPTSPGQAKRVARGGDYAATRQIRFSATNANDAIQGTCHRPKLNYQPQRHFQRRSSQQQQQQQQSSFRNHHRLTRLMARYSFDASSNQAGVGNPLAANSNGLTNGTRASNDEGGGHLMLTMHNRNHIESRQKAATMLAAIVAIFAICYLPVHLINFLRQFIEDLPQTDVTSTLSMLSHCACYLNSAINPIIYNHMNSVFRAEFRKFLSCLCLRKANKQTEALNRSARGSIIPDGRGHPEMQVIMSHTNDSIRETSVARNVVVADNKLPKISDHRSSQSATSKSESSDKCKTGRYSSEEDDEGPTTVIDIGA